MPSIIKQECPCCSKFGRTKDYADMWHCEDCWNKYHNGLKDKDFQDNKTWLEENKEMIEKCNERLEAIYGQR